MSKFIGIDISKQTFDVSFLKNNTDFHLALSNDDKGFKQLKKQLTTESVVIMEASGTYHIRLATFLYENGIKIIVENPLKIKRFSQMNLNRAKTDKKDATVIRKYGELMQEELRFWQPAPKQINELKQLNTSVELFYKQLSQINNQLSSFESSGFVCKELEKELKMMLILIQRRIDKLETKMLAIVKEYYSDNLELLKSIPSIGNKTAIMLISITDNFTKFENYKQLVAYVGFSPRIYQSGTSVNGKGHICKMGKSQIRKLLYMCSLTAIKYNKKCKEMNDRLLEKGKTSRVAKIAIANKLLKQCFAIVSSGKKYQENYIDERFKTA